MAEILKEFDSVSDSEVADVADVHGVVGKVSPMKQGSSPYFNAVITDGEKKMKIVGFSSALRKRLASSECTMDSVRLQRCQVKRAKKSDDLEVVLRVGTEVHSSPKKFPRSKVCKILSDTIVLEELESKHDYETVNFTAKVVRVGEPVQVTPKLRKQDVTVADKSGVCKLTVWQENIGVLHLDSSYNFAQFSVRTYRNEKGLSWPKEGASYFEVEDIGDVAEDDLPETHTNISKAQIIAASLDKYNACHGCQSKVLPFHEEFGQCSKCGLNQVIATCKVVASARLVLNISVDEQCQVSAFTCVLSDIVEGKEVNMPNLLSSTPFSCSIENKIIISINRS